MLIPSLSSAPSRTPYRLPAIPTSQIPTSVEEWPPMPPPLYKQDSGVDVGVDMASPTATKTNSPRHKMLCEGRRGREFYRYYRPIRELTKSGPPICDVGDDRAVQSHRPFSCPDRALTAFCQLGALRMGTKRAMLFFFDSTNAYVLAESTRTLSLQDDSKHAANDDLWLGHSIIPRGYSVCEHTIMLPANKGTNKNDMSSDFIHIVNDLAEDARFHDRPFVSGRPKARFYAGVPITTPRGINIGAYCVLDDEPRPGLDDDSINFMRDMALTVMTHLEMVRATAEHKVGTKMIAGLGAFIDGASGFRDWAERNADWNMDEVEQDPAMQHPLGVQPLTSVASAVAATAVAVSEQEGDSHRANLSHETSSDRRSVAHSSASSISSQMIGLLTYRRSAETLQDPEVSSKQSTFNRAATLLREAMGIDGVMFLDAAVGTFGGLVEPVESGHNSTTYTEMSSDNQHGEHAEANTTGTDGESKMIENTTGENLAKKQCHVLASSVVLSTATKNEVEDAQEAAAVSLECHENVSEKLLRSLLRRYPRGKIWSFNEFGDATSDDDEPCEYHGDDKACKCAPGNNNDNNNINKPTHSPPCIQRRKQRRRDDCSEILKHFPGVRSFGLVGMWDNTRQRHYAASLFWTYSPLRLFSEESEVKYMAAFCDVILAELHRIEAQTSDKAKSDFISTISHELRSPLHGILGSVECLQESEFDSFSSNLISQVEICGRTLLDIIDHLLDFSKINHHASRRAPTMIDGQGRKLSTNAAKRSRMGGLMSVDADVALDQITEEVVETAVYSFCCSRDAQKVLNRNVAVVLDIDRSPDIDWHCSVALGAWKRICINLVSNALKYTSEGHIRVSLQATPLAEKNKKKRFNATFSVTDTGRGMSRDFLENHLFRAFAQEDSLVEGTGLGMNLVAKIVKSFDGKVEVLSERGVGSCFSVTLPLELSRSKREIGTRNPARPLQRSIAGLSRAVAGCAIGVIDSATTPSGSQRADETARALLLSSVHKTLGEVGVVPYNCTWQGDEAADVYLVTEAELQNELCRRQAVGCFAGTMSPSAISQKPFIVLCDSTVSARRLRTPGLGHIATGHVELIAQPAGPERLLKAISSCMKNQHAVVPIMESPVSGGSTFTSQRRPGLVHRGRNDTIVGRIRQEEPKSPTSSSPSMSEQQLQDDSKRAEQSKLERKLSSDYKFPRIPSPSLNGSKPRVNTAKDSSKKPYPKADKPKEPSSGVSLLLVDDNSINLQLLVTYASKSGHRKTIATDGLQAVEAYKHASDRPQVVLMDINMPVLNGFEATRQIRAYEKSRGVQPPATIIALTGLGSAEAQQEAFTSGVDLFLTKPVRLRDLTRILERVKEKKQVQ